MLSTQGKKKLSLLIILAFVLTMVAPGLAFAVPISITSVSPSQTTAGYSADYTVQFITYNNLTTADAVYFGLYQVGGGISAIFPAGTGTVSNLVYVNNTVTTATYSASVARIAVPSLITAGAGTSVTLKVYGITNPSVAGDYVARMHTTADTTVVQSAYLAITSTSSSTTPTGGGGGGGTTTTTTTTTPVAQTVTPTASTTVATADGAVAVTIPAGAVVGNGTVSVTEVAAGNVPAPNSTAVVIGSKVFEISLSGATLQSGVTLSFNYDTTKFAEVPAEQIGLYYYNEDRQGWVFMGGDVDAATGKVNATVNHFTKFAVMANTTLPVLKDVSAHWAAKDIKRLVGMLAVGGYPDKSFKPDNNITRNEFAVILAKAMAWKANSPAAAKFKDVNDIPEWARGSVGAAVDKGIISGYSDGTFGGDRMITKSEIAVMLVKALGKSASTGDLKFTDAASAPDWAKGFIAAAVAEGVVKGNPDNTYAPNANATRAESSTMIVRVLNNLKI